MERNTSNGLIGVCDTRGAPVQVESIHVNMMAVRPNLCVTRLSICYRPNQTELMLKLPEAQLRINQIIVEE